MTFFRILEDVLFDNNDIQQIQVSAVECLGLIWSRLQIIFLSPNSIFCLQIHFLDVNSLDFANVLYYIRQ